MIHEKYGLLTTIERLYLSVAPTRPPELHWRCVCDCGNERVVRSCHLGCRVRTCGCKDPAAVRQRGPVRSIDERFWPKVYKDGPVTTHRPDLGPCWIWTGAKDSMSYGKFAVCTKFVQSAHRVAYKLAVGDIPENFVLDHLCRVPSCVNPSHMNPVTVKGNLSAPGSMWSGVREDTKKRRKELNGRPGTEGDGEDHDPPGRA